MIPFDASGAFRPMSWKRRIATSRRSRRRSDSIGFGAGSRGPGDRHGHPGAPADACRFRRRDHGHHVQPPLGQLWPQRVYGGGHPVRGNGPLHCQQFVLAQLGGWAGSCNRVRCGGVAAGAILPKSAGGECRHRPVGGDLHCGSLRHTLGSPQARHALRGNFRQRSRRPCGIYSCFDPAGLERLGILGAGGRNHCTTA